MKFDKIVSLGYNCEVSFLIEDYWGEVDSYPFSWGYVKNREAFVWCLDHMDEILQGEIWFEPWACMYLCRNSMISFHPKMSAEKLMNEDGSENMENRKKAIAELRSRTAYLVSKLRKLFTGIENVLFLAKVKSEGRDADVVYIHNLHETIERLKIAGGGYKLVLVFEKACECKEFQKLEDKNLAIRYVNRFADDGKTDTDSDWDGWLRIFQEFDVRDTEQYYKRIQMRIKHEFKKR